MTANAPKEKMSCSDFIIAKEHKFLRNIFPEDELLTSDAIKNIHSFHENFSDFLKIVVYLQNTLNSVQELLDCNYEELKQSCQDFCGDCIDFIELKEKISDVYIKSKQILKMPKFALQLYAFVYQRIMNFLQTKFEFETLTTANLFEYVHKIINVKIHLHHSHVTGKIFGYAHDLLKFRQNKNVIPCIAHNFFGFDMVFVLKSIRLSAWRTKDVNIGRKNLTDLNFASIDKIKFIDTMKYYQSSLGKLAETLSSTEKENIKKLTVQFLINHNYFSNAWKELSINQRSKII